MTIDVYYTMLSPPARSVLVVAKHLGLAVTTKEVDLFAGGTRTPEYLKMNPSHTVPTLDDNGFVLFESRAILAYLVNKYSPNHSVYPEDPQTRAAIDKVLFFDASAIFPAIRGIVVPKVFKKIEVPAEAVAELKEKVEIVEAILGDQRFLAGENVTLADISFGVEVPMIKVLYPSFISPKLQAWYDRTLRDVPALEEYNSQADYTAFLKKL
ncbi:PREDICTED: glutathione S-transferase 1-1-like [Rhagoletis zephyria]|uniref:glutathione S-transferase 1-1-like n=1 Tax=Rhagoletis zephyria TaxID=28612 RepID=UPI0008112C7E|nr:PREDICTED: glutathione S-transferase 1-1-like [Rhagoletis zephyria]